MNILELDIETAPNVLMAWGLFNITVSIDHILTPGYTLCWAAKWRGSKKVEFMSTFHDGQEAMIKGIWKLLDEADVVVHYNGRRFDMPTLNKEFIKLGLVPPTPYQQVDLLETVRRKFKFTSNKLDFVARFLGLGAKEQHKGIRLWAGCMEGNAKDWQTMKKYNIQDVHLLEPVYTKLLPWIQNHPNHALYVEEEPGKEVIRCTNCGSLNIKKNGIEHLATLSYQRYRCNECGTPIRDRNNLLPPSKRKVILTQSKL